MSIFLVFLSALSIVSAFTLLDKNNLDFASQHQIDTDGPSNRIFAEKTNEIRKSSNARKDDIHSVTLPNGATSVHYLESEMDEAKKHRKRQRKEPRTPRPLKLLRSAEYCRRTKKCQTIPLAQVLIEKPELAKRLQKWIKIYGPPAEDVIVLQ